MIFNLEVLVDTTFIIIVLCFSIGESCGDIYMKSLRIYQCEDSVDGIFTAVYDAWDSRLGHQNVSLRIESNMNLELFADYHAVVTAHEKAEKVARSVRRKMGEDAYQTIYQAALSMYPEKADCIYRVVVRDVCKRICQ